MKNQMKRIATIIAMTGLALAYAQSGAAQESQQIADELKAVKEEMKSLKEGQQAMQQEMRQLKELLQARLAAPTLAPSQPATISIADEPALGNRDARIVLIDFSDYQCPFCGKFVLETMPQLERDYILTGKVKYVFRDLPLESLHANAFKAAEAAHCAGEQGEYWEMHKRLYQNQDALDTSDLPIHAQALGLDMTRFTQCLKSGKYVVKVRNNMADAENAGLQVTPSFIIGLVSKNGNDQNVKVLKLITGAQPFSAFKAALDSALAAVN
jgi:protein-disulfide isomerase